MKSCPAMNGYCDCKKEVVGCDFLVIKRSSVVWDS